MIRRLDTVALLAAIAGLVLVALAVGVVLLLADDAQPEPPDPFAGIPTCREAGIVPGSRRDGTCRTASKILTVVDEDDQLKLPGLTVRVRGARRRGEKSVVVRLSITNTTDRPVLVNPAGRRLYLSVGGEQIAPVPQDEGALRRGRPIRPGQTVRGRVRFALDREQLRELRRRDRAALGVRGPDLRRVGSIRLRF